MAVEDSVLAVAFTAPEILKWVVFSSVKFSKVIFSEWHPRVNSLENISLLGHTTNSKRLISTPNKTYNHQTW